ncbi:BTAD domain-containing putative transcriptional regulator [Micromonospora sp. NPDC049374]|uniref:AfsR/SARP family transcriptional regulator n=1 Tax=Micromonospora sp. NPDC049374 TaxID=3154352 RepID=UPI003425EAA0
MYSDGTPLPLQGTRERRILGLLAANSDRLVPLNQLVDAVWDDEPPVTAGTQVRNRISRMRRAWGSVVERPEDILVTESGGYLLRLDGHSLDMVDYERDVDTARGLVPTGEWAEVVRLLRSALGRWRGPALAGIGGNVIAAAATRLEEHRLSVTEECLGHELALGRNAELIDELHALTEAHPFRERLNHHLMLALYRSGRQADALAHFQRYTGLLREEMGLTPGPELQELHTAILRQSPSIGSPPTATPLVTAVVAPAQRVGDDARQAVRRPEPEPASPPPAGGPSAPAPLAARPAQLPPDMIDFTGRAAELARLDEFLPGDEAPGPGLRIVVIAGTAGVGKTALATHWGHRVADRCPDGQLQVNLGGYDPAPAMRPIEALTAMLRTLGVAADQVPIEADEAGRLFRSLVADRRMLILLDNAGSAEQVRPLLPGSSTCLVLVTSRNRLSGLLASHGARCLMVHPFSVAEGAELLSRILGGQRLRDNPEAVRILVQTCAGLPLALRIAAANVEADPHRSIAAYTTALREGDPLAALRVDGDSQAVQTVFDVSYEMLPPDAQRLFRLLGLNFGPDTSIAALSAMADLAPGEVDLLVGRLAAANLVQRSEPGRVVVNDLLRLYARRRAESDEAPPRLRAAVEALYAWYVDHASAASRILHPHMLRLIDGEGSESAVHFDDTGAARAWLDRERQNLVGSIRSAAEQTHPAAWLLSDALRGYFWLSGHILEWTSTAQAAISAATVGNDRRGQAAAAVSLAFAHYSQGQYRQSLRLYRQALQLSRDANWAEGEVAALTNIGLSEAAAGLLKPAAESLTAAVTLDRRLGRPGLATTLCALGEVNARLGRTVEALRDIKEAVVLYRRSGSRSGQAMAYVGLAAVLRLRGRARDALPYAEQARELYAQLSDPDGEATALDLMARLHLQDDRTREALDLATAALALAERTNRRRRLAGIHNTIGRIHLALREPERARRHHESAIRAPESVESAYVRIDAHTGLAASLRLLGDEEGASTHAEQALLLARQAGYRTGEVEVRALLADLHLPARNATEG